MQLHASGLTTDRTRWPLSRLSPLHRLCHYGSELLGSHRSAVCCPRAAPSRTEVSDTVASVCSDHVRKMPQSCSLPSDKLASGGSLGGQCRTRKCPPAEEIIVCTIVPRSTIDCRHFHFQYSTKYLLHRRGDAGYLMQHRINLVVVFHI
jgi:hypothetical protein